MRYLIPLLALVVVACSGRKAEEAAERAGQCVDRRNWNCAVGWYGEAARLDPENAKHYYNLGVALGQLGAYEQSAEAFRAALRVDPAYPKARTGLEWAIRASDQTRASLTAEEVRRALRH